MSARDALADLAHQLPRPEHASSVGMATIRMHAALEAVLTVLDAPDPDEHEHDESVYLERANDRLDNIRTAIETAMEPR